MGFWNVFIYLMFPFPLISLLLLTLPLPVSLKSFTLNILGSCLFRPFISIFNFYQVNILLNIFFLLSSVNSLVNIQKKISLLSLLSSSIELKGLKWRYERNFWICFFSMFCWILLYYFYYFVKKHEQLKKELKELKQSTNSGNHAHNE